MSYINLSLRLYGELPDSLNLNNFIGISATTFHKRGDVLNKKTQRIQPIDMWILDLTPGINSNSTEDEVANQLSQAEMLLQHICQKISTLNREKISSDLFVSYTAARSHGSFMLPYGVINAADIAKLEIDFSILTMPSYKNL